MNLGLLTRIPPINHAHLGLLFLVALASLALSHDASGFIEIRKYKVTNSQDVCGDKICTAMAEQRAKKGLSSHETDICGDRQCYAKTWKPDSGNDLALSVDSLSIRGEDFILFKGRGWTGLYALKIKITGQEFETTLRSKTDSKGNLYMPWLIPKSFEGGTYRISALDNIHNITTTARIDTHGNVLAGADSADKCTSVNSPIDWSGCDLYGRILTGVDLRHAKLRGANLLGASLENKDLSGADLSNAVLKNANLDGAKMTGADLSYSNMVYAKIRGADLSGAKMAFAKLYRADFTKTNLTNADLSGATLSYANLSFADLRGANLENAGTWATNLNQCKNHPICQ